MLYNKATVRKSAYVGLSVVATLLIILISTQMKASAAAPGVVFASAPSSTAGSIDITATATTSGSDTLSFLSSSNANTRRQYWNWGTVSDAADCDANGFSDEGDADRSGTSNAVTFTVTEPTTDTHFCIKVLYSSSSSQSFRAYYAHYFHDVTAPAIEVSQSGLTLNALSNDPSGIKTWEVWSASTQPSACDDSLTYLTTTSTGKNKHSETLTANDNDKWYCFRAVDKQDNDGYSDSIQIDTASPTLSASQSEDSATVELSVSQDDDGDNSPDSNTDIDADSWQYVQTSRNCESTSGWRDLSQLTDVLDQDGAEIVFGRSQVNRAYCFRVADEAENYAYASHTIDNINESPVINRLYQTKQSVVATATDRQYLADNSWQYTVNDDQTCNSSLSNWQSVGSNGFSSNDQQNQVTLDISEAVIDASTDNQWLCFRVSDNITDNYGYRSLDVDAKAPDVNLTQNNNVLKASTPTADKAISSSWRYVSHTSRFDCDDDAFELYTPVKSGSTVNLVDSQKGDYFCFRVADRHDNYGYSARYRVKSLDTIAPEITAKQNNNLLTVAPVDGATVDKDTWGYYEAGNSEPDCEEISDSNYDDIDDLTVELDERDTGDWFCIRAADSHDNYGYHSIRIRAVDATEPQVEVDREDNTLEASTTAEDINDSSWQYAISEANDRFNCDDSNDDLNFNSASSSNDTVELSEDDDDKYYCFRVADKAGNHGYGRSQQIYDVEAAPEITILQHTADKRLEISTDATDVDGLTWGWAIFTTDPGDCSSVRYTDISHSQITTNTRRIYVNNIVDTQNNKYYCFRVADTSDVYGTNYGYGKHRYDLTAPSIRFELANNVLTVISDDSDVNAASWAYAKFDRAVDCKGATIDQALPYRKVTLSEADNDSYLCFKVTDKNGNVARERYQVAGIEDDSIPAIDIVQSKYAIIATSADKDLDASTWRYALAPSEPYCDLGHRLTLVKNSGALNKVDLTKVSKTYTWVCFEVADKNDNKGFAKLEIDRQAPTILIQQNNIVLVVESEDEDLDLRSWAYAKSDSADCDKNVSFTKLDFTSKKISFDLTAADSGKYFCFKVADKVGNEVYGSTRIDQANVSAPVIRFSQDNNNVLSVSAANVDASSWAYARSKSDLNCSGEGSLIFNAAAAGNARLILSVEDNGYWYCFKVRGNNGVDGYAKILVDNIDTRAPKVKAVQKGDIVLATAGESVVSWHYVVLPGGKCGPAAFDAAAKVNLGNQTTVDAMDDGLVYCFRATDASGNTGYDSIRVKIKVAVDDGDKDGGRGTPTTPTTPAAPAAPHDEDDSDDDDDEVPGLEDDGTTDPAVDDDATDDAADANQDASDQDGGVGAAITVLLIVGGMSVLAIIVVLIRSSQR